MTDVPNIVLATAQEGVHVLSTGKFAHFGLVGALTKLAPHGIEHEFGHSVFIRILLHVLDIQINSFVGLGVIPGSYNALETHSPLLST